MKKIIILISIVLFTNCEEDKKTAESSLALEEVDPCESTPSTKENLSLSTPTLLKQSLEHLAILSGAKVIPVPDLTSQKLLKNTQFMKYNLFINDTPLCHYKIATYTIGNRLNISGNFPTKSMTIEKHTSLPTVKNFERTIRSKIKGFTKTKNPTKCFYIKDDIAYKSLKATVFINNLPYEIIANKNKIFHIEKKFFSMQTDNKITTQIYQKKAEDLSPKTLIKITLNNVSDTGELCSNKFKIVKPNSYDIAQDSEFKFFYNTEENKFEQVTMFTNATLHTNWIENIGKTTWPSSQIKLILHEEPEVLGKNNVARYTPMNEQGDSVLELGQGDGIILDNLRIDPDVISHEANHHFIYQNITSVQGESLVLHEGLADALVMLKTQDPCLGEWICPTDITCLSTKCLRTADNDMRYDSKDFQRYPTHVKSQLISGLVWDIAKETDNESTAKIIISSIKLLGEEAIIADFLQAIIDTEDILYNKKNCETIVNAMNNRGFSSLLNQYNITCSPEETALSSL
jgi:hypothetical protein